MPFGNSRWFQNRSNRLRNAQGSCNGFGNRRNGQAFKRRRTDHRSIPTHEWLGGFDKTAVNSPNSRTALARSRLRGLEAGKELDYSRSLVGSFPEKTCGIFQRIFRRVQAAEPVTECVLISQFQIPTLKIANRLIESTASKNRLAILRLTGDAFERSPMAKANFCCQH